MGKHEGAGLHRRDTFIGDYGWGFIRLDFRSILFCRFMAEAACASAGILVAINILEPRALFGLAVLSALKIFNDGFEYERQQSYRGQQQTSRESTHAVVILMQQLHV